MGYYASAHRDLEAQQLRPSRALFLKDDSGSRDTVQGKLVTMVEEEDNKIMLAAPVTLQNSGMKKRSQKKAVKPVAIQQHLRPVYEDLQIQGTDDETPEVMDEDDDQPVKPIRETDYPAFQQTSANSRLPQTRTTKTGRVQQLVVPKIPQKADSIRGMTGQERFDIRKIFDLPLEVTVSEFLDRSDLAIREMAFNIQRSTPRYQVKKPGPIRDEEQEDVIVGKAGMNLFSQLPSITARVLENDGMSLPLMISSWVLNQHLSKTLLDGGSLVELLSRQFVRRIKPRPAIQRDGYIRVSLANDSVTTLDEYVIIPINIEGMEAILKAWLVDVEVYDLLLGITWMRRANCTQMFGEGKITIKGNDKKIQIAPAEIYPIEVKLPIVEFDNDSETNEWTADDACQELLDQQGKVELSRPGQREIRAYNHLVLPLRL